MTAKKFVSRLNESLNKNLGSINGNLIEGMRIQPKKQMTSYKDELSSLINNYEIEGTEIGIISFFGKYQVLEKYLLFGRIELDPIGIDRLSREIVMLDHDEVDHLMLKCAKDSTSFLKLLDEYANRVIHSLSGNTNYPSLSKEKLYEIAGGDVYKQFVNFCFA